MLYGAHAPPARCVEERAPRSLLGCCLIRWAQGKGQGDEDSSDDSDEDDCGSSSSSGDDSEGGGGYTGKGRRVGGARRWAGGNKGRTKAGAAAQGLGTLPEALLSQFDGSIEVRAGLGWCGWASAATRSAG